MKIALGLILILTMFNFLQNILRNVGKSFERGRVTSGGSNLQRGLLTRAPAKTFQAYTPYGLSPTKEQQQTILRNPALSTPGYRPPSGNQDIPRSTTPGLPGNAPIAPGGGQVRGASTEPSQAINPNQLVEDELGNVVRDISDQIQYGNLTGLFPFDEALAKSAAVQRFAPYYAQTFQDFLRGLNLRQQRGTKDTGDILSELQERSGYVTGRAGSLLEQAQEQTGQQFAERGLFESGARRRAQGLLGLTQQKELQNLLGGLSRRGDTAQEQQRRLLEDISVEKAQQERETARAQETDVASSIEQARGRALSGATELERYGPQPGEDFQNFIRRRGETLRRFVYG